MTALDDLVAPPEQASTAAASRLRDRLPGLALVRETSSFLGVGGVAYVVDVAVFNLLLTVPPFSVWHPSVSRCVAVVVAMVITYTGNRFLTWRHADSGSSSREVALFVVFNLIGLAMSLVCLVVSHDLLGLTSRLADNISANVVGLAAGTAFRFWSYRRFVFTS
jgi:putative flippase GtrA